MLNELKHKEIFIIQTQQLTIDQLQQSLIHQHEEMNNSNWLAHN